MVLVSYFNSYLTINFFSRYDLRDVHANTMDNHVLIEEDITYVPISVYDTDVYIGMWWGHYMTSDFTTWGVRFLFQYKINYIYFSSIETEKVRARESLC